MKKFTFLLAPAMLVAGCAQNIEFADPATMTDAPKMVSGTQTRSLEGAVYNEVVAVWTIASTSTTWLRNGQCREKIENLVGTSPVFGEWIDDFDTWISAYPLVYTPLQGPHDH